ncbi:prepilin-type N-terminal cleavage/methylation domain-containing protein [Clostridioides sp. ZZV15-6388]|uniref:type II secretion system protein n=1 Tax=Clostridioides sp. ZZV15-6388 TaxID=2811499 RepID=UPI001D0FD6F2|nr:prepilin-type N-terminal cleavage/methylation domain-containing protein [Clostridioides sp. ZZV15-6388]
MKLRKNKKGFTLVELLVVIAIIGILAVVAVPALFSNINKAKVASVESDYSSVKSAALSYYSDENKMPTSGSLDTLKTYMDTLPDKADIGGGYELLLVNNKLALKVGNGTPANGVTLTKAQIEKLLSDLGPNKIYTDNKLETDLEKDSTVKDGALYIVLIDNAEMDSTNN